MIETYDLRKRYKDGTWALNGISLVADKRVTSIIGRNGAGKTTFIRILSTQLAATSGSAFINGLNVMGEAEKIRKFIVSIPQEAAPIGVLTPQELISLYLVGRGNSLQDANRNSKIAMAELGIDEFRNRPTDTLSGGTKRKVFVAMAIASNADFIFLDEPTTGLDPISRLEVWSAIRKIEGKIVLTTHYMEEASELSDMVLLVDGGLVLEKGTVRELMARFEGKVRIEGTMVEDPDLKIGTTMIKYVNRQDAQNYVDLGNAAKQVSLDDVFITHGVEIES